MNFIVRNKLILKEILVIVIRTDYIDMKKYQPANKNLVVNFRDFNTY